MKRFIVYVLLSSLIFLTGLDTALAGNAIIWDTMVEETGSNSLDNTKAWANKFNWKQVPYGTTGVVNFIGNVLIETDDFWLWLPNKGYMIQPAMIPKAFPGSGATIYNVATVNGVQKWDYYQKSFNVVKNQADEIIFIRDAGYIAGENVIRYRLKSNSGWLEETPMNSYQYRIGLHYSPGQTAASPNPDSGNDMVKDKDLDNPNKQESLIFSIPESYKYGLYQLTYGYVSMMVIPKDMPSSDAFIQLGCSIDSVTGECNYLRVGQISASNVRNSITNNAVYIGMVNQYSVFRHATPNIVISAGGSYTPSFKPTIAGKWRVSGRVNDVYYTQTRDVQAGGNLIFTSPVAGTLESVVVYLYDRNSATPANVKTPQDIYRNIFNPTVTPTYTVTPTATVTPTPPPTVTVTPTPTQTIPLPYNDPITQLLAYITQFLATLFKA